MVTYSLLQAARKLRLPASTLSTYLAAGKIPEPKKVTSGHMTIHLWTDQEIEHVRKLLPKIANGRKTRYQKLRDKKQAPAGVPVPHKKKRTKKKK
jgi:hypothetical protein